MAACAFRKQGVLGMELHAQLEMVGRCAVFGKTNMASGNALDRACIVIQHLSSGETGEYFNA